MKFTDFKTRTDVIEYFNLEYSEEHFIREKEFDIDERDRKKLLKNFKRPGAFSSESSICEMIIAPILLEVCDKNDLPVWSHCFLECKELDLSGYPDYLFALAKKGNEKYKKPIVCCGEAKKDDFTGGWGQVAAEMVAAQKENKNDDIPIYGLVTNGKLWEFSVLKENNFILHEETISATRNFQEVLDCLNWIFFEAKKNADILEELENKEKLEK